MFWKRVMQIGKKFVFLLESYKQVGKLGVTNFVFTSSLKSLPESSFDLKVHVPRFTRIVLK